MAKIKSRSSADMLKMLSKMAPTSRDAGRPTLPDALRQHADIENPISAAQAEEMGKLRKIELSLIDPDPNQPRRTFDPEGLKELQDTIAAAGRLIHPPVVRPNKERAGRFMIVAGERRVRACQRLGWTHIECCVEESISDTQVLLLQLIENSEKARQQVRPIEEALALRKLEEMLGNAALVADAIGHGKSYVSKRLALLDLNAEILQRINSGDLGDYETALNLQRLSEIDRPSYDKLMQAPKTTPIRRSVVTGAIKAATRPSDQKASGQLTLETHKGHLAVGLVNAGIPDVQDLEVRRAGATGVRARQVVVSLRLPDTDALDRLIEVLRGSPKETV